MVTSIFFARVYKDGKLIRDLRHRIPKPGLRVGLFTTEKDSIYFQYGDREKHLDYGSEPGYQKGWVELTKNDINRRIMSGKFEAVIHYANVDTLYLTEGRFDVKY